MHVRVNNYYYTYACHESYFLTVPDTVTNLTVRVTDDEILILWIGLQEVVSHYIITVYQADGIYHQFNTSQYKLHLIISKEEFIGGEQSITQIHVSAANAAGAGQPAVVLSEALKQTSGQLIYTCTICSTIIIMLISPIGQGDRSIPTLMITIGGTVAANILLLTIVVVASVVLVKRKRRSSSRQHTLYTNDNVAYGVTSRDEVATGIHQCNPNCSPSNVALELQSVPPRKDLMAPSGTTENKFLTNEAEVYECI